MARRPPTQQQGQLPDQLQTNRRANLRLLLAELGADGIDSDVLVGQVLGIPRGTVAKVLAGEELPDDLAREVEWAMNRPTGWLDRGPAEADV